MKKNNFIVLGILLLISNIGLAQEFEKRPKVDEMHIQKFQFLVEQAQLTPDEATLVNPIFMDYEKVMWTQHKQNFELFKSLRDHEADVKPNFAEMNDNYVEFEIKQAQLFKNYHLRLRKILKPETLFHYYKAERDFKRRLLKGMQDHKDPKNQP